MQEKAEFWPTFGLILAWLFMFSFLYACAVRWLALKNVRGQTAYTVAFGVAVTVISLGLVIGWVNVLIVLAGFASSGFWMILEYAQRVYLEDKADRSKAEKVAKDFLK